MTDESSTLLPTPDGEGSEEGGATPIGPIRGLSPVVGTVLMVLVTVILAALVSTQIVGFGLPASEQSPEVSIQRTISTSGLEVVVTSGSTDNLTITVNGSVERHLTDVETGDSVNISNLSAGTTVDVIAERDGLEQVIHAETISTQEAKIMDGNGSSGGTMETSTTAGDVIGETGKFNISTNAVNDWQTLAFRHAYEDPVVIISPVSSHDNTTVDVRVKGVTGSSAKVKLEEWDYSETNDSDGAAHAQERVAYLVVESGKHTLSTPGAEDNQIIAGTVSVNESWTTVNLTAKYPNKLDRQMRVFSQAQTYNEPDAVITRHRNVNNDTFDMRLQEQETYGDHATEQVGYVAGFDNNVSDMWWLHTTSDASQLNAYDEDWFGAHPDLYDEDYVAFAQPQSFRGGDPIVVRYNGTMIVDNSYEERLQEGPADGEFNHIDEYVSGWALQKNYTLRHR